MPRADKSVSRRKILYFSGFDPRGASAYHGLTTEQFERHCRAKGAKSTTSKRKRLSKTLHSWTLMCSGRDTNVTTEFQFCVWDDLVRQHWIRSDWHALTIGAWAYLRLVRLGAISHMLKMSRPIAFTGVVPLILIIAIVLIGSLTLLSFAAILSGWIVPGLAGVLLSALAVFRFSKVYKALNAPWISRINAFEVAISDNPTLENWNNREAMARNVLSAVKDGDNHEILIVAHSVGTQIGLLALADAMKLDASAMAQAIKEARLCFVTLGQTIPVTSQISQPISRALKTVGESSVCWLDVSAPADPACYALVDSYQDRFHGAARVHVENARFFQAFAPETYRKAQADRFVMHFLYLMTPDATEQQDRLAGFDLYALMTAPELLAESLPDIPSNVKPFYARATAK